MTLDEKLKVAKTSISENEIDMVRSVARYSILLSFALLSTGVVGIIQIIQATGTNRYLSHFNMMAMTIDGAVNCICIYLNYAFKRSIGTYTKWCRWLDLRILLFYLSKNNPKFDQECENYQKIWALPNVNNNGSPINSNSNKNSKNGNVEATTFNENTPSIKPLR